MTVKETVELRQGKTCVLLSDEGEVRDYAARKEEIANTLVIALTPYSMYELDRRGISYKIIDEYCTPEELTRIGARNSEKVIRLCSLIDERLSKEIPFLKNHRIRPAWFNVIDLHILFDGIILRMELLSRMIAAEKPDAVIVYKSREYDPKKGNWIYKLLFNDDESIYAHILALGGWDTTVLVLPKQEEQQAGAQKIKPNSGIRQDILGYLKKRPYLFSLTKKIRKSGLTGLLEALKEELGRKDAPVLIFGDSYNWDDCLDEFTKIGIGPFIRMSDDLESWMDCERCSRDDISQASGVWKALSDDPEFRGFFNYKDIDFYPIVRTRFSLLVEELVPAYMNAYRDAERVLEKRGIRAILASQFYTGTGRCVSQAARNKGVPVITWQHGAYGAGYQPLVKYYDLMSSDIHFVFGEGIVDMHKKDALEFNTQLAAVGSSSLDMLVQREKKAAPISRRSSKKKLLYVTSCFLGNAFGASTYPPFSDDRFWITQQRIIDLLGRHPEYDVVVKMHPGQSRDPPVRDYAEDKGYKNISFIRNEVPFRDLIFQTDVIVGDLPSTTLVQALTTSRPMFVYLGHYKLEDKPLALLKKRAYCSLDLEDFIGMLDDYLQGRVHKPVDLNNKEYLEGYGISSQGCGAGKRAATALKRLI